MAYPVITIYTPTYKRPNALSICQQSIELQTDDNWQHVVIPDEIGLGIDGMYADIPNHVDKVRGDYVMVLSDDDRLKDSGFIGALRLFIMSSNSPDVVIFKVLKSGRVLPSFWDAAPQMGHIDLSNFAVKAEIWKANAQRWGRCYEGDYYFIKSLWEQNHGFSWLDYIGVEAQRISRGMPE